jgi:UPF0148 protein
MTKKPEDIMTEYLLNGAKMLSEPCPVCDSPLFDVKGKKMCVVCANTPKEAPAQNTSEEKIQMIVPKYAAADQTTSPAPENILTGLDDLILKLCTRAAAETEPERCRILIECIRTAAEAKTILSR